MSFNKHQISQVRLRLTFLVSSFWVNKSYTRDYAGRFEVYAGNWVKQLSNMRWSWIPHFTLQSKEQWMKSSVMTVKGIFDTLDDDAPPMRTVSRWTNKSEIEKLTIEKDILTEPRPEKFTRRSKFLIILLTFHLLIIQKRWRHFSPLHFIANYSSKLIVIILTNYIKKMPCYVFFHVCFILNYSEPYLLNYHI